MKKLIFLVPTLLFFMLGTSCAKRANIVYFQGESSDFKAILQPDIRLKKGDLLEIKISSSNPMTTEPFGGELPNMFSGGYTNGNPYPSGFLISENGTIKMPVLGEIILETMRRDSAAIYLEELLRKYINEPVVLIRITNYKVTVLGDVARPGSFTIPNERINVIEAIGIAGDLNITGKRKNIKVIRETDTGKMEYLLDLTSKNIFNSPAFFLQQNDIVYVEPNKAQMNSAQYSQIYTVFLSATALIITTINLLTK